MSTRREELSHKISLDAPLMSSQDMMRCRSIFEWSKTMSYVVSEPLNNDVNRVLDESFPGVVLTLEFSVFLQDVVDVEVSNHCVDVSGF